MKNKDFTPIILIAIFVLIDLTGVFYVTLNQARITAILNTNKSSLLAEVVGHPGDGLPVKIEVVVPDPPRVSVTRVASDESVLPPSSCVTQQFLDQYFGGSKAAYNAKIAEQLPCNKGYLVATNLQDHIGNDNTSIQEIDLMINAVQVLLDALKNSPDGFSAYIIPGGLNTTPRLPFADNIAMQCIRKAVGTGFIDSKAVAVGGQSGQYSLFFDSAPDSLVAELADIRKQNTATYVLDQAAIAKNESRPTLTIVTNILGVQGKLSEHLIAVTQEILLKDYKVLNVKKIPISLSVLVQKDGSGNKINCNADVSKVVRVPLAMAGLGGDFFLADIEVDDLRYSTCLPVQAIISKVKKNLETHLTRLQKLKAGHIGRGNNFQTQLDKLAAKNYNCSK